MNILEREKVAKLFRIKCFLGKFYQSIFFECEKPMKKKKQEKYFKMSKKEKNMEIYLNSYFSKI